MSVPEGYDPETFEYVGPCPTCGTDHGNMAGPETLGGQLECVRTLASRARDVTLMALVDQTRAAVDAATKSAIVRHFRS